MDTTTTIEAVLTVIPVFEDPVAYLASLGIEAELVAVVGEPMAPAAA